jgi:threonylcarbamoyladenosine tRNA methylthiotransferase MtaB
VSDRVRISLSTFGCKVNRIDSAWLIEQLAGQYEIVPRGEPADVYLINSCAVTSRAAAEARRYVARCRRDNPGALIVLAGCYAQGDPENASATVADLVVGNSHKALLPDLIGEALKKRGGDRLLFRSSCKDAPVLAPAGQPKELGRTRAFVSVQDGCNYFCSYCIVPHTRGEPRSLPIGEVLLRTDSLADAGYRELVLCGIHLGLYGCDLEQGVNLVRLLEEICEQGKFERVRISSIEPNEISPQMLDLFEKYPQLCRHFHLPLQSGDEKVLKVMSRRYGPQEFERVVQSIGERLGQVGLGLDVITGFPGESESAFRNTYELIEKMPVTYLHVFPFSPRPGTPAAQMKDLPPAGEAGQRATALRELAATKKVHFYNETVGEKLQVLFEKTDGVEARGYSRRYIPVVVRSTEDLVNKIGVVTIAEVSEQPEARGELEEVF